MESHKFEDFHSSLIVKPPPIPLDESGALTRARSSSTNNLTELTDKSYLLPYKLFKNQMVYLEGWILKRSRFLKVWRR